MKRIEDEYLSTVTSTVPADRSDPLYNQAMKKFLINLSFGVDFKLYVLPLMYNIKTHNVSGVRNWAAILIEEL